MFAKENELQCGGADLLYIFVVSFGIYPINYKNFLLRRFLVLAFLVCICFALFVSKWKRRCFAFVHDDESQCNLECITTCIHFFTKLKKQTYFPSHLSFWSLIQGALEIIISEVLENDRMILILVGLLTCTVLAEWIAFFL